MTKRRSRRKRKRGFFCPGQNTAKIGWFSVLTAESIAEHPVLIVSMVEDVKGRGGSGYVVGKDKEVLESWFSGNESNPVFIRID